MSHDNLPYLYLKLNEALKECQRWAAEFGLDISQEKTKYMLFTRKRKPKIPVGGLTLKGKRIEKVSSLKYLGMTLDDKLTWTAHIKERLDGATKLLFKLKSYIGKTWGPSPKMTLYAYTSCIRPQLSYGSFAFASKISKHMAQKLRSFQRKVLMTMGNFRDNTPGDSLEVILDIMPLDIFLRGEAKKANYRLKENFDHDWSGVGKSKRLGHVLQAKHDEIEMGLETTQSDKIDTHPIWEKNYTIVTGNGDDRYQGFRCYTDGSKTRHGVGSGACIMMHTHIMKTRCYGLKDYSTVFQAELYAIQQACKLIVEVKKDFKNDPDFKNVRILSDSKSALQALDRIDTDSRLVKETKEALNTLSKDIDTELCWIKAHVNYKGNEMADNLAKTGTKLTNKATVGPSRTHINSQITNTLYREWNERWQHTKGMRQTKLFLPNVFQRGRAKKTRDLNRYDLGVLIRNITGHAFLRRHNYIIGNSDTHVDLEDSIDDDYLRHINSCTTQPQLSNLLEVDITKPEYVRVCRKCRDPNSLETPYHLFTECPAVWEYRREHLHTYEMNNPNPKWRPRPFVDFFNALDLEI